MSTDKARLAGIVFHAEGDRVRIKTTLRSDLARGRLDGQRKRNDDIQRIKRDAAKAGRQIDRGIAFDIVGVVETPSPASARKLRRVLEKVFGQSGASSTMATVDVADALTRCRRLGLRSFGVTDELPEPSRMHGQTPIIEKRYVQDPMMTRAELLHQLDMAPNQRWVGHIKAEANMSILIGGLARVRRRTEAQTRGAGWFRDIAERAQLGGARAIDYTAARVDTSGPTETGVADAGADARAEYKRAREELGLGTLRLAVAERVVVEGETIAHVAEAMGFGKGGAAREKLTSVALDAADILALISGNASKPAQSSRIRADGDKPSDTT
jgi:hypothetical protein